LFLVFPILVLVDHVLVDHVVFVVDGADGPAKKNNSARRDPSDLDDRPG
jgi:hypothetical protein